MGRSIDNISSNTTMNLASGTGISIQGNEIAVDPTTVTLDTETQQLQAQVTAIQSTANLANSKAELLASAQYGLIENVAIANNNINVANNNINFLLPYFDTTYTTIVNNVQVQSRDAQPMWHDRDLRWKKTKTNQSNLELPNGMYECKFRTLGNSSGMGAS